VTNPRISVVLFIVHPLLKNETELREKILECFRILNASYGNQGWYKRLFLLPQTQP
jgi:hypothetical protein